MAYFSMSVGGTIHTYISNAMKRHSIQVSISKKLDLTGILILQLR